MTTVLELQHCRVDLGTGTVQRDGETSALTEVEIRLVAYMVENVGREISRSELLQEVWGYSPSVRSRAVDQTMKRLRPKIEINPRNPRVLQSVFGVGYRLVLPVAERADEVAATPGQVPRMRGDTHGRGPTLEAVHTRLAPGRVLAVTGPPGVGKSHVVRAATIRWRAEVNPPGGVWCIDCRDVTSPDGLIQRIGQVTRASPEEAPTAEALGRRLAARGDALLVLDDCDRIEPLEPILGALARHGSVPVLASLRRRLDAATAAELEQLPLGPLEPDAARTLLEERTRQSGSDVQLPDAQTQELLAALGHNPLAICLAAAHCSTLSLQDLVSRFGRDPSLLAAPAGRSGERFSSVQQALSGSWDTLEPGHQETLAALSAFAGSFRLDAALAVAGDASLAGLQQLAARSLLEPIYEEDGVSYALPVLVRAFAARSLPRAREAAASRLRVWLGERFDALWQSPTAFAWDAALPLLRHDGDLERVQTQAHGPNESVRLGLALAEVYRLRGDRYAQHRVLRIVSRRLTDVSDPDLELLARTWLARHPLIQRDAAARRVALGELATLDAACRGPAAPVHRLVELLRHSYGDVEQARAVGRQIAETTAQTGDPLWEAVGQLQHGRCVGVTGALDEAVDAFEHAILVSEGRGAPGLHAYAHYSRGYAAMEQDDRALAEHHFENARGVLARVGDPRAPMMEALLGLCALLDDRLDAAETRFRAAARYADARVLGWSTEDDLFMGYLSLFRRDLEAAEAWLARAVDRGRRWGAGPGVAGALLAAVRVARGALPATVRTLLEQADPRSVVARAATAWVRGIEDPTQSMSQLAPGFSTVERALADRSVAALQGAHDTRTA